MLETDTKIHFNSRNCLLLMAETLTTNNYTHYR